MQRWWRKEPATLTKPSGLEYLDTRGYRDLQYERKFANNAPGLYEKVVSSFHWHQAMSTSKREVIGSTALGGGSSYFHRTVRLCKCGRELQKIPDDTRRVNDDRQRATTAFHVKQGWTCALKGAGCLKYTLSAQVEGYWECRGSAAGRDA